jgi:hypothetical protein
MINLASTSYEELHNEYVAYSRLMNPSVSMANLSSSLYDEVQSNATDSVMSSPKQCDFHSASESTQKKVYAPQEEDRPLAEVTASWQSRVSPATTVLRVSTC